MKRLLCAALVFTLAGCQNDQEKAERFAWKSSGQARFYPEAEFNGCKVGTLEWINSANWKREITAVVCDGQPSQSVSYSSGKTTTGNVMIGTKSDEQIKAEQEAIRRAALSKLTDEEIRLLGVK